MSALSVGKKQKYYLFAVLLGLLVLNPVFISAGNQDKALVLKQAQLTTGRVDRPVRPVKNVILLIPDGCSLATVSAARWYQWLLHPDKPALSIDPYLCGTVRTSCSNAPTGDSAPTTSTYMTGELSRAGYVATYAPSDGENDIFTMDSTRAYQPLMTVLEAVKLLYGKSTGLVFTCEFPHATPADCASHDYSRSRYTNIASQMVHNRVDVVMGGGCSLLKSDLQLYLKSNGYTVQMDDAEGLRAFDGTKLWSLFKTDDMPFDIDRNPAFIPSLEEMTSKAIQSLSKNKKGFFLMVEGSKVDWAAHANDPVGMITDFLAFDKACQAALDFARKDGNTAVIILPDHGNSGISIGTSRQPSYGTNTKEQIFGNLLKVQRTAAGLAEILNACPYAGARDSIYKYTRMQVSNELLTSLTACRDYAFSPVPYEQRKAGPYLSYALSKFLTLNSGFGFTTNGHTAEEVFVANYHPKGDVLNGVRFNFEVNDYLCKLLKLDGQLPELTAKYFAKHTDVFKGCDCQMKDTTYGKPAVLTVNKGTNQLVLTQNSNVVKLNDRIFQLPTVVVYVDKNQTFYLPASLADWLK
jgi:alkaline phosphatase